MIEKISAFIIVHNEEGVIETALKSLKGVVDEILVLHDGPCSDNTIKISKKYTNKIFILPHKGRASLHMIKAFKLCKNDWLFKLDADEFLSDELKENIGVLAQKKDVGAYKFFWPLWDKKRYRTKNWPHKKTMFRKSQISFLQFPGWDEPQTKGKVVKVDYLLNHRPKKGNDIFWDQKSFWKKTFNRTGKTQIEYTLKDFKEIKKYQYDEKIFPRNIRIRKKFPLLSAPLFAFGALIKAPFVDGAWKEGWVVFKGAIQTFLYYLWLGWKIYKLKKEKNH